MSNALFAITYLCEMCALSAILALLKCESVKLLLHIGGLLSHFKSKSLNKALVHISDIILVCGFSVGYILLTYVYRDGVIRIYDLIAIFLFYLICKRLIGTILKIINNILRQICLRLIIRPLKLLHRMINSAILRIIRSYMSEYK